MSPSAVYLTDDADSRIFAGVGWAFTQRPLVLNLMWPVLEMTIASPVGPMSNELIGFVPSVGTDIHSASCHVTSPCGFAGILKNARPSPRSFSAAA
jgi:hypothetical protein